MTIDRLPTPSLLLDESIFQANREAMKSLLKNSSVSLRPHYKSHKCAAIAHMQIQDGAIGMTCAKLDEAMDLADSGIEDILIANQIVDSRKLTIGAQLAGNCRLTVCVDNRDNIAAWEKAAAYAGTTVHCLIEYEIGMQRCGVTEIPDVIALAEQISECPHLQFDGIQAYAGHVSHMEKTEDRRRYTMENSRKLRILLEELKNTGFHIRTVSGGSTGTAAIKASEGLYTELQAGSYLFMDATYRTLDLPFRNALTVLSTVVSAKSGLIVVDAGVKSCGVDQGMPEPIGLTAEKIVASEEHFQLHQPDRMFRVGERIRLIPGHCCSTVNLYDKIYLTDGDTVIDRIAVTARGCCR
ncbi:MAG: DSD1 family PLP-dependent enzyme [Clostridia bacterium]|nr:DSD1 family PLP-dependent enzyme [Clostridia bacterium]